MLSSCRQQKWHEKLSSFLAKNSKRDTQTPALPTESTMSGKTMTGREKSKSALKSEKKNADCASEYVYHVESATKVADLEPDGQRVARVIKALGAGRLEVQFPDGTEEKPTIAKKIRFHGRAATKGDQSNCMGPGDLVIVDGGFLFGKLSAPQVTRVGAVFKRHGIAHPSGFFATAARASEEQVDDVLEWDRSAEEAAEAEAAKEREFQEAENRRKWRPDTVVDMAEPATEAAETAETAETAENDEKNNPKPWLGKRGGKRVAAEGEVDA
jgi:translation initiation factor IF-1